MNAFISPCILFGLDCRNKHNVCLMFISFDLNSFFFRRSVVGSSYSLICCLCKWIWNKCAIFCVCCVLSRYSVTIFSDSSTLFETFNMGKFFSSCVGWNKQETCSKEVLLQSHTHFHWSVSTSHMNKFRRKKGGIYILIFQQLRSYLFTIYCTNNENQTKTTGMKL